ncbi:hypothetical protein ERJ75_000107800 [Trypanosoma vivax]|nr:hypothetical protein ERJ75_000107800 [Trypanosoma vivax]
MQKTIVDNEDVVEDALAVLHAAVQASEENQRVFATNASSIGENMPSEASSEEIFTFFPHRVVVRDCIPYHSRYFVVMVNHKPIVPGHLMIVPIRCVGTIGALTTEELEDFGHVIHATINALRRFRAASSCLSYDCSDVGSGEFGSGKRSDGASSALSHDHIKDCGFSIAIQMGELGRRCHTFTSMSFLLMLMGELLVSRRTKRCRDAALHVQGHRCERKPSC